MQKLTPEQILNEPLLNKGTAFTNKERDELHLHGFLPCHVSTMQQQLDRRYQNFLEKPTPLAKYSYLSHLQNRNEILFYRLVYDHVQEMLPLIYTPTVGDVSLLFSVMYRKNRGIYISYPLQDKLDDIFSHISKEIDVIVATDGERVLGLGDVGIGGMAISLGKLSLYSLFGGIHPARTLPIMLDVGTNNQDLLNDPLYLGWRHPRITGAEYDAFIDAFVKAVKRRFPKVLLQWEDFAKPNARPLLDRYRNQICSFNDDIQGTAAVVLAAVLSAVKLSQESLKDQKIAILGAGSAGLGIAHLIVKALVLEGCSEQEARQKFYIVDRKGLVHDQIYGLDPELKKFAQPHSSLSSWAIPGNRDNITLLDVVNNAHPTILIGVSGQPNMFTETIVKNMGKFCKRPIILPLSNPTSHSEAQAADLVRWTEGRAIIATGSPFAPVTYNDKKHLIAQCNNVYIFPGVGLGAIVSGTPHVTDEMFITAAQTLSEHSPIHFDPSTGLFPDLNALRSVSRAIALAIVELAQKEGLSPKTTKAERDRSVDHRMWFPAYN